MDIKSLCLWRATCRQNYLQGTAALRRFLTKLLNPFVHSPSHFVRLVSEHDALFGGEAALAFILRDSTYLPTDIEIYIGQGRFAELSAAVLEYLSAIRIHSTSETIHPELYALRRLISKTLHIRLTNDRTIHLHCSFTSSAVAGIARSVNTGLSNYVSGQGFGCSHPMLTLRRRALYSDVVLEAKTILDVKIMENMASRGFHFAATPSVWPEYVVCPDNHGAQSLMQCWRSLYMCPSQGRYFGDYGSFVNYFDPLAGDAETCVSQSLPPYGPMLAWRLMTTFPCSDDCDEYDDLLGDGATSLPILVVQNSLGRPKDMLLGRVLGTGRCRSPEQPRPRSQSL